MFIGIGFAVPIENAAAAVGISAVLDLQAHLTYSTPIDRNA